MNTTSLEEFYRQTAALMPGNINKEIGHFNVFRVDEFRARLRENKEMPYNRRAYYKISLIIGRNRTEYADKVIDIDKRALLFATPRIPYHYIQQDDKQSGHFCIFTADFLMQSKSGVVLDELPIFRPGGYPIFQLSNKDSNELSGIFLKMHKEISSNYIYKYDLIRNYVLELIHFGQKLQPASTLYDTHNASSRISSLFIELLERQFPIESPRQRLALRTAIDFSERLSVHVNHLNKVLKENTGRTTTDLIAARIVRRPKFSLSKPIGTYLRSHTPSALRKSLTFLTSLKNRLSWRPYPSAHDLIFANF